MPPDHHRATEDRVLRAALKRLPGTAIRAALIGTGIRESRTPGMHMAEGARLGLDYAYALLDFDVLDVSEDAVGDLIRLAADEGYAGLNITHPFKQGIIPHLDRLSAEAAAIGAVNTVVFEGGHSVGHNTDCWGFVESFRTEMDGADLSRVLLLGAGGAGRAVAQALEILGADKVDIFDLDAGRSTGLAAEINARSGRTRARSVDDLVQAATRVSGAVNTTPVGMAKYPGVPLPRSALRSDLWIADVVYFPAETELLSTARAAGCRTMPGNGMAVLQAVRAFELITGRKADRSAMFRHFALAARGNAELVGME